MRMGLKSKSWVLILLMLALLITVALLINQYITTSKHGRPTKYQPTQFSLPPPNVHVFVVGPQSLINNLTKPGLPSNAIGFVSPSELSSIPNGSVVIIDWGGYVNRTLRMSYDELANALEIPMGSNDLIIIISENPNETLMLEETMAVAWGGNYYHSKVIGFPIFPTNESSYIIGFGNAGLTITVVPIIKHSN